MVIKDIVKDLCQLKTSQRADYIYEYLISEGVTVNKLVYEHGLNLEVVKNAGSDNDVVFIAHYDVFKDQTEGANDNASSVAVLLRIAVLLKELSPSFNIRIVFSDKEELLGGLFSKSNSIKDLNNIIKLVGSYNYLISLNKVVNIKAVFVLELSGIGDALYVATKSGAINCSDKINNYIKSVTVQSVNKILDVPVSWSDLISVYMNKLEGTVIGMIPYNEGKQFINAYNRDGKFFENYPHSWKNMHGLKDNYFTINEKSLINTYDVVKTLIDNISVI